MSQAIMHRHEPDRLLNPVKLLGEVAGETGLLRAFWDNGQVAFCWRTPDTDGAYRVAAEIYGVDGRRWAPLLDFDDDKLSLRSMTRDENREAVNPRGAVRADKRDGNSMARQRGFDLFG